MNKLIISTICVLISISLFGQQTEIEYNSSSSSPHIQLVETDDTNFARIWLSNDAVSRWAFNAKSSAGSTDNDGILSSPLVFAYNGTQVLGLGSNGALRINQAYTLPNASGSVGQVIMMGANNNAVWATPNGGSGAFEIVNGVVRSTGVGTEDFILGAQDLPVNGQAITDTMFFFDHEKGAFRGGTISSSTRWSPDSIGAYSFAFGSGVKANGFASIALGTQTVASGQWSTAMGTSSNASGTTSTALGHKNEASGNYSTAMGFSTDASGVTSTAMGTNTLANGTFSTALGNTTVASGTSSTAMGSYSEASGDVSIAMGSATEARGFLSIAMGTSTIANGRSETVVGLYNDTLVNQSQTTLTAASPLFSVGNGTIDDRSNAFVIKYGGRVDIPDSLVVGGYMQVGAGQEDRIFIGNDYIKDGGASILRAKANFTPDGTGIYNLGGTNHRWKTVFATNGTINTSDLRAKKNITALTYGLKEILELNPVQYNWKQEADNDEQSLGLIAQDILKIIPEVVHTPKEAQELMGVNYAELVPVLIKAIQEQEITIRKQTDQIEELYRLLDR